MDVMKEQERASERFRWNVRPMAAKENIYEGNCYRFTVLTDRLIRLEYSQEGQFEDRASQMAFYRDFPNVDFSVDRADGQLVLETSALCIVYREDHPFQQDTLRIQLKSEPASVWHYGDDFEDLGGTIKTLDQVNGACPVERGVCSRYGYSVIDDSNTVVLNEDGWIGVRKEQTTDCYFFGYGYDYIAAVSDFYKLTGNAPMLPAYALGNWWSRYYTYTQQEYCDLMVRFREENVPFSVAVVDMDWHITQVPEELQDENPYYSRGWTGYSWNKALFPDYKAFLSFLKKQNLNVALNLHPADGICRHEDMYPQMARACGVDPATGKRIPLDVLSPQFMEKYFDVVHHPYEEDGVDFWWMDWQQGTDYSWIHEPNLPGHFRYPEERTDPLWLLNHLHILDISRNGKRPMFFSRYAGPGSHRYPVGFSGDTFVTWDSLRFQPYFTATASNIGYSWWSHDIGGHMWGYRDDELTVRWVQLGVFSPILRLHSMNSIFQRKEPWCYAGMEEQIIKKWLRLRHSLFPYLYTMNERNHRGGLPLIQPMYYSHPKQSAAYEQKNQYWFGSELIVSPITEKTNPNSRMGCSAVWLPEGDWFDFFTGLHYASRRGRVMEAHRTLDTMPVFAKAGGIIPMAQYEPGENRLLNAQELELVVFPGADDTFTLYEDAGDGYGYTDGQAARTKVALQWGEFATLTVFPAEGSLELIPQTRKWKIALRGWNQCITVSVTRNGMPVQADTYYDKLCNTTYVLVSAEVTDHIQVCVTGQMLLHDNMDVYERCEDLLQHSQMNNAEKDFILQSILQDGTLHEKLFRISGRYIESEKVVSAIKELLSLTEDEYLGCQLVK